MQEFDIFGFFSGLQTQAGNQISLVNTVKEAKGIGNIKYLNFPVATETWIKSKIP